MTDLDDVLVVTVRKSFWASPEADRWPRRLYLRQLYGPSTNLVNSLLVFVRALVAIWLQAPRLVLLGSVERTVPWFIRARRLGLLRGAKLVVTNQLMLSREQLAQVDRVIVYARAQAEVLGAKGAFAPLPADGDLDAARRAAEPGEYVFSGGGAARDFATLVDAVRGTDLRLELVVFEPSAIADPPPNVSVLGPVPQAEFLRRLAGAALVVVPLLDADSPHGQTLLVQALALAKPVVATRSVGVIDYVNDWRNGLLVDAGDVDGFRRAMLRLSEDCELRRTCARNAAERARDFTAAAYASRLRALCEQLLRE